jgi:hypothetical protein
MYRWLCAQFVNPRLNVTKKDASVMTHESEMVEYSGYGRTPHKREGRYRNYWTCLFSLLSCLHLPYRDYLAQIHQAIVSNLKAFSFFFLPSHKSFKIHA